MTSMPWLAGPRNSPSSTPRAKLSDLSRYGTKAVWSSSGDDGRMAPFLTVDNQGVLGGGLGNPGATMNGPDRSEAVSAAPAPPVAVVLLPDRVHRGQRVHVPRSHFPQ